MTRRRLVVRLLMIAWDCASWVVAIGLATFGRFGFSLDSTQWASVVAYVIGACALQVMVGLIMKLYLDRFRTGSFEEALGLLLCVSIVAVVLASVILGTQGIDQFPRSLAILTPPIALMFMAAGRWICREWRARRRAVASGTSKVLVYGAGDLGYQLVRLIALDASAPYRVVGFIDDDRSKRNLRLQGVPVRGTRADLTRVAHDLGVTTVILAISRADADLVREVSDLVEGAGMRFKVLPHVSQIIGGKVRLSDIRDVEIEDILGRREIHTDVASIADYLSGRRVLITGAGGSIGSELARQVHRFNPASLILLDRDESALHAVQLSIYGKGLLDTPDMVLADIRDADALRAVFERHRPEVVFHAAALKHLPMLEQYPDEGWKTNVLGTRNVLAMSAEFGVGQFVNISTDKAANPTSVLGKTKRIAEQLTAWQAEHSHGTYLSVRFGNVLGSRGSMLHTFLNQIAQGGPVTVTHPEITRYFMTIPEACELVIQAASIGQDGEVLVLDMGEPIKILDVAKRLIAQSGKAIEVVFTGVRPGEKLHEDLFSESEQGVRPYHPLISHVGVPPLDPADLGSVMSTLAGHRSESAPDKATPHQGQERHLSARPAGGAAALRDRSR